MRLAGGNVTLAGMTLVTGDPLFSRRVTLAQRNLSEGEVRETPLVTGFLYRLALEGRPAVSNVTFAVDVPVQSRELLLTIHNDDNPPLNLTAVEAKRRPVFATLLNDRSVRVRALTAIALGKFQARAAVEPLFALAARDAATSAGGQHEAERPEPPRRQCRCGEDASEHCADRTS